MLSGRSTAFLWISITAVLLFSANWNQSAISRALRVVETYNGDDAIGHDHGTNQTECIQTIRHQQEKQPHETTIIITSSLMPTHPSLNMIDQVMESLAFLTDLPRRTRIIIAVDGLNKVEIRRSPSKAIQLAQYIEALHAKYVEKIPRNSNQSLESCRQDWNVKIMQQPKRRSLVGNLQRTLKRVKTKFVYVIQHDMPFVHAINHSALIQTFHDHPHQVRLVRFSNTPTLMRPRDNQGLCGDQIEFTANNIRLSKTHIWSDRNHLTRKSYYEEMFDQIDGWDKTRFMEALMLPIATRNCSYWGTHVYGNIGFPPTVVHLNGRLTKNATRSPIQEVTSPL